MSNFIEINLKIINYKKNFKKICVILKKVQNPDTKTRIKILTGSSV